MSDRASLIAALQAALAEAQALPPPVVIPPPTVVPPIFKVPFAGTRLVLALSQWSSSAYERFQNHRPITTTASFYSVHCFDHGTRVPLSFPLYTLEVFPIDPTTFTPTTGVVRASGAPNAQGYIDFAVTLGDEPDGLYLFLPVAYNAQGVRQVNSAFETYLPNLVWIDRNGKAKDVPLVGVQTGSYVWIHNQRVAPAMHYTINPKTAYTPVPRPLPLRTTVTPFPTAVPSTKLARVQLMPGTDSTDQDPHYAVITKRGITVTESRQGYEPDEMYRALPRLPDIDGERGVAMAWYTLSMSGGRNGKWYDTTPHSIYVIDSTGKKKTLAGLTFNYPTYWEDAPTSVTDPRFRIVGDWDPAIPVEKRYPWESWAFVWDAASLALDGTAPPIGGEQPHAGKGPRAFSTCRHGRILEYQFNATDREVPVKVREFITGLNDPWGMTAAGRSLFITERGRHAIVEYSMDTGAKIRDVLIDPAAVALGNTAARQFRPFPGYTVTAARNCKIAFPEAIHEQDGWLHFGSIAQQQIRKVNIATGELVAQPFNISWGFNFQYLTFALSDGTTGPRGTTFIANYGNAPAEMEAFLPDGTRYKWGNPGNVYNGPGGEWVGASHYRLSVAVHEGRIGTSDTGGAINSHCLADAYDGPMQDQASILRGYDYCWAKGYTVRHGPQFANLTTLPLPVGENADVDNFLRSLRLL